MILLERSFEPEALLEFLTLHFPDTEWFHIDLLSGEKTTYDQNKLTPNKPIMGIWLEANISDNYPIEINLLETDEVVIAAFQTKIAQALSQHFMMKTVIDFTHPDHPHDPYYSLLYDNGACYLVSDSQWEETDEFKIIGPWSAMPFTQH